MHSGRKLKLIRLLNGMSQKEMALLLGVSLSHLELIEECQKRLTVKRAALLYGNFNFNVDWLVGQAEPIEIEPWAAFVYYSGNRTELSSRTTRNRWRDHAHDSVQKLLPVFVGTDFDFIRVVVDANNPGDANILLVFGAKALVLNVRSSEGMVKAVVSSIESMSNKPVVVERDNEWKAETLDLPSVKALIEGCDIENRLKEGLFGSANDFFKRQKDIQAGELNMKNVETAERECRERYHEDQINRYCDLLIDKGVNISRIIDRYRKKGRVDLLEGLTPQG